MFRHIVSVLSLSFLSQGIGVFRTLVIASLFGASRSLDAYYLALIVPALFTGVIGGALQAGFVPVYVRRLTERGQESAAALRGTIFWILLFAITLLSIGAFFSASYWAHWIASRGGPELQNLTTHASRIIIFSIFLNSIGDYFSLVLNCHRRFALASAAPIANTLISVPALLSVGPSLDGLAWSVILGATSQLVIVALGFAVDKLALPFNWQIAKNDLVAVVRLVTPILPAFVFTQFQAAYIQALPASLGEGAVSIFGYATRLHTAVEQVFVIGVGTVLLPHLAELVARGDYDAISKLTKQIVRFALVGAALLQAAIWLVGKEAVQLLLTRGSFDQATGAEVSNLWLYLALGIFPFAVSTAQSKLVMALGRPSILAGAAAVLLVVVYSLGAVLPGLFGVAGVALIVVIAQCVRVATYSLCLRRFFRIGSNFLEWSVFGLKLFAVVAIAAAAGKMALWGLGESPTFISMIACVAIYFFTATVGLWLTQLSPFDVGKSTPRWLVRTIRR